MDKIKEQIALWKSLSLKEWWEIFWMFMFVCALVLPFSTVVWIPDSYSW